MCLKFVFLITTFFPINNVKINNIIKNKVNINVYFIDTKNKNK